MASLSSEIRMGVTQAATKTEDTAANVWDKVTGIEQFIPRAFKRGMNHELAKSLKQQQHSR
jgi:hypothetical protein